MSFSWPLAKLDTIQSALTLTADNVPQVVDDGSDEWNVASPAYDRAIAYAMENGSWGYAKQTITLQPSPVAPQDPNWDTAYPVPQDCVHILMVKINQIIPSTPNTNLPALTLWDIGVIMVNGSPVTAIMTNSQGGPPPPNPPVTPSQIMLTYISNSGPLTDSTNGTPTLILALQAFVMSGIYRGLHEDTAEADKLWKEGLALLQEARARYDMQKPKRQIFNSRITAARRIRRPWPPVGNDNWGGSGIPG
jgi:hypothetical protein